MVQGQAGVVLEDEQMQERELGVFGLAWWPKPSWPRAAVDHPHLNQTSPRARSAQASDIISALQALSRGSIFRLVLHSFDAL